MMSAGHDLPLEIIEDILIRVPAKSLGRFTCVSKNWCSLICNPQFIKTHLHLNKNHKISTLVLADYSSTIVDEPRFPRGPIIWNRIIGSCNGLVLAVTNTEQLYLMNPTTKEVSELPYLYFYAYYFYGFGYDSSSDDYKVVMLRYSAHETEIVDMFISVYSLGNNSWRNLQKSYSYDLSNCDIEESGVFVNGNLHWLVETSQNHSPIIIAFCLANEELAEIELPENVCSDSELLNIGGKLGLYAENDMWVMEEYGDGKSWTKVSIHRDQIDDDGVNWALVEDAFLIYYRDEDVLWRNVKPGGLFADIGVTYVETLETPY